MKKSNTTTISLDIESFYPSVKFNMVKKAINYYSKKTTKEGKSKIKICFRMIKLGMENTMINFKDKCYKYREDKDANEKGLTWEDLNSHGS